ncbi:MAG: RnfABCDGE type electron transport complex subunit D [Planctomycetes bacterium]|nr:RnfABCDGE type electron transport complex subunit D [Planctomycetota bacterium]
MTALGKTLEIRSSPHILSGNRVDTIMWNVVLALLPVSGFAVYAFGIAAVLVLAVAVGSCVLTEHLLCRVAGKPTTVADGSAVITGLLYGLTLPPGLALWMVAVGGVVAIAVGKALFGGLGQNPFNPALVARAILQAAFPVAMTTWAPILAAGRFTSVPASLLAWPFSAPAPDATSTATPLSAWKFDHRLTETPDLLLGTTAGSVGETCAVLILLGGAWLIARRMMNWRIPAAIFATVAALSAVLHAFDPARCAGPEFMLLSGGLMLGAVFMATDMVGSPMTHLGCVIHGVVIGVLVVVIRVYGGMPEGVMYAILLANALVPHLDRLIQPRVYGTKGRGRKP